MNRQSKTHPVDSIILILCALAGHEIWPWNERLPGPGMRSCSLPKPLHPASSRRPVPTYLQLQRVYQNHHFPYRENLILICPGGRAIGRVLGFFSPRLSELTRTSSSSLLPLTIPFSGPRSRQLPGFLYCWSVE